MDPSPPQASDLPLPNHHIATTRTTLTAMNHVQVQPRSTESSNQAEWDEPLAPLPDAKLRLMCSYGGHIIPRPHDKSLSYVGGETRMVSVERNSTLQDLVFRLSNTLLDGRRFTLKYQLPNEELDSLISVASDEDLENMVEEYDRILSVNSSFKSPSGRLRLFLFFAKPETSVTMSALLDDAKSETWFVDALNGADMLPRGLSDSAVIDDLLGLGSAVTVTDPGSTHIPGRCSDASAQLNMNAAQPQDVHSTQSTMPDSPLMETTTSSFESSTSSPSMGHLTPIHVRADESNGTTRSQDDIKGGPSLEEQLSSQLTLPPPLPTTILTQTTSAGGGNENNYPNHIISDDDRSDHGVRVPARKPPLPLPLQHVNQRFGGAFNLPSPDSKHAAGFSLPSPVSVKSDSSIASETSFSKIPAQKEPDQVPLNESNPSNTVATTEQKPIDNYAPPPPTNQAHFQPMQDPSSYIYPPPPQHQYIQPNMHYIPSHHAPLQSYYQGYATTQQSIPPQIDHQQHSRYPLYILSVNQTQPYNVPVQPGHTDSTVTSSAPRSHAHHPVYQTRPALPTNNPPGLLNPTQYHQYLGHYNQASALPIPGNPVTYGNYEYSRDIHQQVYYTGQVPAGSGVSQYQSITPAEAAMIAEGSMQLPTTDSNNQPQGPHDMF